MEKSRTVFFHLPTMTKKEMAASMMNKRTENTGAQPILTLMTYLTMISGVDNCFGVITAETSAALIKTS